MPKAFDVGGAAFEELEAGALELRLGKGGLLESVVITDTDLPLFGGGPAGSGGRLETGGRIGSGGLELDMDLPGGMTPPCFAVFK